MNWKRWYYCFLLFNLKPLISVTVEVQLKQLPTYAHVRVKLPNVFACGFTHFLFLFTVSKTFCPSSPLGQELFYCSLGWTSGATLRLRRPIGTHIRTKQNDGNSHHCHRFVSSFSLCKSSLQIDMQCCHVIPFILKPAKLQHKKLRFSFLSC